MKQHIAYLTYVLRHKWFVFWACLRLRVPLRMALVHDWTKFLPREWSPYVRQFYNKDGTKKSAIRDKTGAYDPAAQPIEFQAAWLSHQRNKHHWQAWVSLGDRGCLTALPIPCVYVREMVADWIGAGAAQGKVDPKGWYAKNGDKMVLDPGTRSYLEGLFETKLVIDLHPRDR